LGSATAVFLELPVEKAATHAIAVKASPR